MRIGIVGTGAIAAKHADAWRNIGSQVVACTNRGREKGEAFAERFTCRFVPQIEQLCRAEDVELVDVCTFPDVRIEPVVLCAELSKPIQLQKPLARTLAEAREIREIVEQAGITAGVVSQHRFDGASLFLKRAIEQGRLGAILQADCYVKWYRSPAYYARAGKGEWNVEGGGALINQAIHQVDLLRWLVGPVHAVMARWRLGALHAIESEDLVNAILTYKNGAMGAIQASTALWPGYPERVEIHGTTGSAIITGDRLTRWDVQDDQGERAPLAGTGETGAADPMAISLVPFERQFHDLIEAYQQRRPPLCGVDDGVNALAVVEAVYESCRDDGKAVLVH